MDRRPIHIWALRLCSPTTYAHGHLPARPFKRPKIATSKPTVDVPDDTSVQTSHAEPCPTQSIDHEPDRLHEEYQVKPDERHIRLRIKPPKAKIILRLTHPKRVVQASGNGE